MTTGLWPALLAALVGSAGRGPGITQSLDGDGAGRGAGQDMAAEAARLLDIRQLVTSALFGRHALYWWIGIICFVALAYATNPTDASFRNHLTDLSFHLHLRRLRANEPDHLHGCSAPGDYKSANGTHTNNEHHVNGKHDKQGQRNASTESHGISTSSSKAGPTSADKGLSNTRKISFGSENVSKASTPGAAANARSHVLSFSNRVSINLKTPSYIRTSYGLFSTVRVLPTVHTAPKVQRTANAISTANGKIIRKRSATKIGATKKTKKSKSSFVSNLAHNISSQFTTNPWTEQGGYFVGFLGYWWTIDDGTSFSGMREKTRLGNSILSIEEQDEEDENNVQHTADDAFGSRGTHNLDDGHHGQENPKDERVTTLDEQSLALHQNNAGGSSTAVNFNKQKQLSRLANNNNFASTMRAGQRRVSPTPRNLSGNASSKKRSSSGESTPVTPTSASSVASANLVKGQSSHLLATDADKNLPGLPFHVDQASRDKEASKPFNEQHIPAIKVDSSATTPSEAIVTASHAASAPESQVTAITPAAALLQSQLDDLRVASAATQTRLQAEIDDLRSKKQDEDVVRADLKARTKSLEDTKRAAEAERLDSEKKLISARSTKKSIEDRVSKAKSELTKLEKREKETEERVKKARTDREAQLVKMREEVKHREEVLKKEEEATDRLSSRVTALEAEIVARTSELQILKEDASYALSANARARLTTGRGPSAAHHHGGNIPSHMASVGNAPANIHRQQHMSSSSNPSLSTHFDSAANTPGHNTPYSYYGLATGTNMDDALQPPSPGHTPPGFTAAATSARGDVVSNTSSTAPFATSFIDHRAQRNRFPGTTSTAAINNNNVLHSLASGKPVSSSINTSVIGNSATAASALYDKQVHFDTVHSKLGDSLADETGSFTGSTFAPFGPSPLSPSSDSASSQTCLRSGSAITPPLKHAPYFVSDTVDHTVRHRKSVDGELTARESKPVERSRVVSATDAVNTPSRAVSTKDNGGTDYGLSSSVASEGGGTFSPMTPHQASLIPSQLFDLFDETDEMAGLPNRSVQFSEDSIDDGLDGYFGGSAEGKRNGSSSTGHESPITVNQRRISNPLPSHAVWDDVDDFDFLDKPVHGAGLSRNTSLGKGRRSPVTLLGDNAASHDGIGLGRPAGTVSPLLGANSLSGHGQVSHQLSSGNLGKSSPSDLYRRALALNPDAEAFNFSRPLPSSGSSRNAGLSDDARLAFESGGGLGTNRHGSNSSLEVAAGASKGNTWASPVPGARSITSLQGIGGSSQNSSNNSSSSALGHSGTNGSSGSSEGAQVQQQKASSSSGFTSFSPFDDDDLLKGW